MQRLLRVRLHIIDNARIKNVGKYQSCMVSKFPIICKQVDELRTSIVGAKDLVVTILPSPLLTSFEALGAVMDWPMVAAVLPGTPLATDCPDVALHSLTAIGEVSCVGITMADATAVLQTELTKCLADDLRGSETTEASPRRQLALTFRRSSSRVQFDLTMNE